MTGGRIDEKIIADRVLWIRQMVDGIRDLPISDKDDFLRKRHTVAAAESYLRRALEALFDMGRHILARKYAHPATEYKEVAAALYDRGVIDAVGFDLMKKMAGYRNRMVHFYHEVSPEELWDICANHLSDIDLLLDRLVGWLSRETDSRSGHA